MSSETEIRPRMNAVATISQAFEIVKTNYPLFLGMIVIQIVVSVLSAMIPYIGSILSGAVSACLLCGYLMAVFASLRSEQPKIALLFEGFSRFIPLLLFVLIQTIPFVIVASVAFANNMVPKELAESTGEPLKPEQIEAIIANLDPRLIWLYAGAWALWFVFRALMFFTLPIVADQDVAAPAALSMSFKAFVGNAGQVILLIVFQTVMIVAGLLACFIGFVFLAPFIYAAEAVAYRQVFGTAPEPQTAE